MKLHGALRIVAVKADPLPRHHRQPAQAIDEEVKEHLPTHLAIGDDVDAGGLLDVQGLVDGAVLCGSQRGGIDLAGAVLRASLDQSAWTQHGADDLGPVNPGHRGHDTLLAAEATSSRLTCA